MAASIARAQAPSQTQLPAPAPARAFDEPDTSYAADLPEPPIIGLTLEEAQRLAEDHSPAARAARADLRSAQGHLMIAAADFDPVLSGTGQKVSQDIPVTSPFASSEIRSRSLIGGLSWLSPIGTRLAFSVGKQTIESNAPFSTLPRERHANGRIDVVQPLINGFGPTATRGELRAANQEVEAAREAYRGATLDLDADVENAYWNLFATQRRLAVQRLLRQRAAVFLHDQMLRGRAGVVGPAAVSTARTFLAEQESALLDAYLRTTIASDQLGQVIGTRPTVGAIFSCQDEPSEPPPAESQEVVLARAYQANATLAAARADSAAAYHRARAATWNAWPTLEAFGGYGASGLAGTGRQVVFGSDTLGSVYDTGFNEAWSQVTGGDYPDWNVGLRLVLPIGWRAERGEREVQAANYDRARELLRAQQLDLETRVLAAHREAEISARDREAVRELVAAAEEQARIARLEYQSGRTTAYDLVNQETDLAAARLRETEVRVRIMRAATELRRLTTPAPGRTTR